MATANKHLTRGHILAQLGRENYLKAKGLPVNTSSISGENASRNNCVNEYKVVASDMDRQPEDAPEVMDGDGNELHISCGYSSVNEDDGEVVLKKSEDRYALRKLMPKSKNVGVYDFPSSSDESKDSEEEYVPDCGTDDEKMTDSTDEDDQCSTSSTVVCSLPTTDSEAPVTSIQVMQTNNTKGKRSYDKRDYCLFCSKPYSRVTKHWDSIHGKEPELLEIRNERHEPTKEWLVIFLRNKGNHMHNCSVIKEGKGELVVSYRPSSWRDPNDYRVCADCLGYFSRKELCNHKCKAPKSIPTKKGRVANKAAMLLPAPDSAKQEVMTVLIGMKKGIVKRTILGDELIMKLASKLYLRHGQKRKETVRARVREVGRFLVAIQKMDKLKNATLKDCLRPQMFRKVIDAVRSVAKFDASQMTYQKPSVAIKLGHTLNKCAQILRGVAIETSEKETEEAANQFTVLCELEWSEEVAHGARKELYDRKRNAQKRLPLTSDTKRMVDFLKREIALSKEKLESAENDIASVWRHLAEVALAYLIIFNRRRQGEVSKITVDELTKAKCGSTSNEIESCLTEMERQLCRLFYRLEIVGKRGRTVPLLMDVNMFDTLRLLNRKRLQAGVSTDNMYIFALNNYSSSAHIRGSDCLRKFSVMCGATHPETLRSTSFRKHVATMSQILSLKDNELDMLAQFLGHDVRTHREYYRLPDDTLQLAKLSKLFLLMEKGSLKNLSGRTLDSVLLEVDADSDVEPEEHSEDESDTNCDNANDFIRAGVEAGSPETQQDVEHTTGEIDDSENSNQATCSKVRNRVVAKKKQTVNTNLETEDSENSNQATCSKVRNRVVAKKKQTVNTNLETEDSENSNQATCSKVRSKVVGKKKRVQVRWSQSEKDAVERHLHGHILRKIVPGKEMILRCLQQEKLSLSGRTWRNIRDYCRNRTVWDKHA